MIDIAAAARSGWLVYAPRQKTYRACPGCGHEMSQDVIESALSDYACPFCEEYRLSEFVPLKSVDSGG